MKNELYIQFKDGSSSHFHDVIGIDTSARIIKVITRHPYVYTTHEIDRSAIRGLHWNYLP